MQQIFVGLVRAQRLYAQRRRSRLNRQFGPLPAERIGGLMFAAYAFAIHAEFCGRKSAAARFAQRAARYEQAERAAYERMRRERLASVASA